MKLDVAKCGVSGIFKGAEVLAAIRSSVPAEAKLAGCYRLNPEVKA
jgi:hypothetical protein